MGHWRSRYFHQFRDRRLFLIRKSERLTAKPPTTEIDICPAVPGREPLPNRVAGHEPNSAQKGMISQVAVRSTWLHSVLRRFQSIGDQAFPQTQSLFHIRRMDPIRERLPKKTQKLSALTKPRVFVLDSQDVLVPVSSGPERRKHNPVSGFPDPGAA